jgi:hypothetical protein
MNKKLFFLMMALMLLSSNYITAAQPGAEEEGN